jgi:hypothetical protein
MGEHVPAGLGGYTMQDAFGNISQTPIERRTPISLSLIRPKDRKVCKTSLEEFVNS